MSQQNLDNILNDCIDKLAAGSTIEECLRAYPEYADILRPLLQIGQATTPKIPVTERAEMRIRLDAEISGLIENTNFTRKPLLHMPSGSLVLVASLIVVVIGLFLFLPQDTDSVGSEETLTPTATSSPEVTAEPTAITPEATAERTTTTVTPMIVPDATATQVTQACTIPEGWVEYRIQAGDTLSSIAVGSDTTTDNLQEVNCIDDARFIVAGQVIFVPRQPDTIQGAPLNTNQGAVTGDNDASDEDDNDDDDEFDDDDDWDDDDDDD